MGDLYAGSERSRGEQIMRRGTEKRKREGGFFFFGQERLVPQ